MRDEILPISKAAEYLGVFSLTLRNWEKIGKLKSFRTPGGHRRFKKSELDRLMGNYGAKEKLVANIERLNKVGLNENNRQAVDSIITELKSISEEM